MLRPIDSYFINQEEPEKSCLLFLRDYILGYDQAITEAWKYKMPFYLYNDKMFSYLWKHKHTNYPYIGIVQGRHIDHPLLLQEKRAKMKILLIDPVKDIPISTINEILKKAIVYYKS
jgi:hypothetical protein